MPENQLKSVEKKTEKLENFVNWIAAIWHSKNWTKKLLFIDILIFVFLNKLTVSKILEIFGFAELIKKIPSYTSIWGLIIAVIFIGAVIVAIKTSPRKEKTIQSTLSERSPIKGLRPFESEDAEIFAEMQRKEIIRECLNAITYSDFRFGIITGESGSGKTSFAQAGLKGNFAKSDYNCVYVKFTNLNPLVSLRMAINKHFQISGEQKKEINDYDLLEVFKFAVRIESKPVVFIFDQFEQFFIWQKSKEDRGPFIQSMADWFNNYSSLPVKILISIRGVFSDHMIEFQKTMGYTIGPQQHFRVEKFTPRQATEIFRLIARVENMDFDEKFVEELAKEQLASKDGLVTPVNMQILAWMIKGQSDSGKGFDRKTYEKLGGIEGLLEIFLRRSLDALLSKEKRQNALKVLITLIDSERNQCSNVLTLDDLQKKLSTVANKQEVEEIVNWLVDPKVRLISPNKGDKNITSYELSHEKIIPAIRKIGGKELSETARANQLLERRANEWKGNDFKSKYLLNWRELRLIKKHINHLTWGKLELQKKKLIKKSKKRLHLILSSISICILAVMLFFAWWYSPQGQIQKIKWKIADLVSKKIEDDLVLHNIAIAYAKNNNLEESLKIVDKIDNRSYFKSKILLEIVEILCKRGKINTAIHTSESLKDPHNRAQAYIITAKELARNKQFEKIDILLDKAISDIEIVKKASYKAKALMEAAKVLIQLGRIDEAISVSERLSENPYHKCKIFLEMANVLNESKEKNKLLGKVIIEIDRLKNSFDKVNFLVETAKIFFKAKDTEKVNKFLDKALDESKGLKEPDKRAWVLTQIAAVLIENKDSEKAKRLLDKAIAESEKIKNLSEKSENLKIISKLFARDREIEELILIVEKIEDIGNKAAAFLDIAVILAEIGNKEKFFEFWNKSISTAENIKFENERTKVMLEIAKISAKYYGIEEAITFAGERKTSYTRVIVLAEIAKMIAKNRNKDTFKKVVNTAIFESKKIKSTYYDPNLSDRRIISFNRDFALISVVRACSEAKKWHKAFNLTDSIIDGNNTANALAEIIVVWAGFKYPEIKNVGSFVY